MVCLEQLFDRFENRLSDATAPRNLLTEALRKLYGGPLGFHSEAPDKRPYVICNFVTSLDGVVTYAMPGHTSGGEISGGNPADRMLMGILRACADAVVAGARTIDAEGGSPRTADAISPDHAPLYAELRRSLGKERAHPLNVLMTRSGRIDFQSKLFQTPDVDVVALTTEEGGKALCGPGKLRDGQVVTAGSGDVDLSGALHKLRDERGVQLCLLEGGPTLLGQFLEQKLVDEMFLTFSPRVAGRDPAHLRPGLVERGVYGPENSPRADLVSLRRYESFLFARYVMI